MNLLRRSLLPHPLARPTRGLEEFFEFGKPHRVGRSWLPSELRLKSQDDLHKLWFVLLKERNMLETLRLKCIKEKTPMSFPDRIVKVRTSMARLKNVFHERVLFEERIKRTSSAIERFASALPSKDALAEVRQEFAQDIEQGSSMRATVRKHKKKAAFKHWNI